MSVTYQGEKHAYDVFVVMYGWVTNFPAGLEPFRTQLMDAKGKIATDPMCRTSIPKLYAIGDVAGRLHQCVTSAFADGVTAAKAIQQELNFTIA